MELDLLPHNLAVGRLEPSAELPESVAAAEWSSVTRTEEELSVVCTEDSLPKEAEAERGWRALKVRGPLAFDQVGILAALSATLAAVDIPIFVISSYDTDYLLIKEAQLGQAVQALEAAGHSVHGP